MTPLQYWTRWVIWTVLTIVAVRLILIQPILSRLDELIGKKLR